MGVVNILGLDYVVPQPVADQVQWLKDALAASNAAVQELRLAKANQLNRNSLSPQVPVIKSWEQHPPT